MRTSLFVAKTSGLSTSPSCVELVRVLGARSGEDVRRRALGDLRREIVRAGEVVGRGRVDLREDLGERRGGEDGGVVVRVAAARRAAAAGERDQRESEKRRLTCR
jgi:hypothetical protein